MARKMSSGISIVIVNAKVRSEVSACPGREDSGNGASNVRSCVDSTRHGDPSILVCQSSSRKYPCFRNTGNG